MLAGILTPSQSWAPPQRGEQVMLIRLKSLQGSLDIKSYLIVEVKSQKISSLPFP